MNRLRFALGVLALGVLAGTAPAEHAPTANAAPSCCPDDCCNRGGFYGEAEFLFLRYHRSDGVRTGDEEPQEQMTDNPFEFSPRLTIGYAGSNGLGARLRWWDFDSGLEGEDTDPPARLDVDTYNIDVEVFERFALTSCWEIELSGGIRYNKFNENLQSDDADSHISFDGYGGIVGIEAQRSIGRNGSLYGRARVAIVMGDKRVQDDNGEGGDDLTLLDSTQGMLELAFGYEHCRELRNGALAFGRIGAEFQNWFNYSKGFDEDTQDNDRDGASDVGFGGFGFSLGVRY